MSVNTVKTLNMEECHLPFVPDIPLMYFILSSLSLRDGLYKENPAITLTFYNYFLFLHEYVCTEMANKNASYHVFIMMGDDVSIELGSSSGINVFHYFSQSLYSILRVHSIFWTHILGK